MKFTVRVRKNGVVTIPKDIRNELKIEENTVVEIDVKRVNPND